jgi:anti-sigma B factor antagonist
MDQNERLLDIEQQGGITIVRFAQSQVLDQSNVNELGNELMDLVEQRHRTRLLINFSKVEYLTSAVLGKLIALHKKIQELNGELKLCGIRPSIYEVFKITKLNKVFEIFDDEDQALSSFRGALIG